MVMVYIKGLQGESFNEQSIVCMIKYFFGGGLQKEGFDFYFVIQKGQIYLGENFDYYFIFFEVVFKMNMVFIMFYYGIFIGQIDEDVAMVYNKVIIIDLLCNKY